MPTMLRSRKRITCQRENPFSHGLWEQFRKQVTGSLLIINGMIIRLSKKVARDMTANHLTAV